ncbi:MAG: MarR family transcriptional regulator, partial [Thermomicrobium sp.]|nr:MarR family transcriptional regulator [Thermomicrobium sp.]
MAAFRPKEPDTPNQATELLLQTLVAARALELLGGTSRPAPTERDIAALHLLMVLGPLRASEIAALLRISRTAVTRVLDSLEHAGLAHREPDPRDRRAVLIAPTPAGRLVALAELAPAVVLSEAIARLSTDQQRALMTGLQAVLAELYRSLPPRQRQTVTSSRARRSRSGTTEAQTATTPPAISGQPLETPVHSDTQPAESAPTITPSEY